MSSVGCQRLVEPRKRENNSAVCDILFLIILQLLKKGRASYSSFIEWWVKKNLFHFKLFLFDKTAPRKSALHI